MANSRTSAQKLPDTHLVILSAAAARDDQNVLPTPTDLKARGATPANALKGLWLRGLIEEVCARRYAD